MVDFSKYQFRASQNHKLMTGSIGITDKQEDRLLELSAEKETLVNKNGNKVKWTAKKQEEYDNIIKDKKDNSLPKTMQNYLRSIHRAETFHRNFIFTNKYLRKGIDQEREATTTLMRYFIEVLKIKNTFFKENEERIYNYYFQGETDINPFQYKGKKYGIDTKCSWSLETFPYEEDELDKVYEYQNQTYMDLTDSEMWITAYVLVNCTEQALFNEKQKYFYALGMPGDVEHRNYDKYIEKCRLVERMLIFDYDRFVEINPYHDLEHTESEWKGEGLDIPLKNRVCLKESFRDDKLLNEMRERVIISRKYLTSLNNQI